VPFPPVTLRQRDTRGGVNCRIVPGPALGDAHIRRMGLDDRTADSIGHAHAIRLRREKGVEQLTGVSGSMPMRNPQSQPGLSGVVRLGADQKFTGPIPDNGHGLNAVDEQVQDHLLQLDPVRRIWAAARLNMSARQDPAAPSLVIGDSRRIKERTSLTTSLMSRRTISGVVFLDSARSRAITSPASFAQSIIRSTALRTSSSLRNLTIKATSAGIAIGDDCGKRLVHFMAMDAVSSPKASPAYTWASEACNSCNASSPALLQYVHQDTDISRCFPCLAPDAPALLRGLTVPSGMSKRCVISMFCAPWTPVQRLAPALMRHLDGFAGAQDRALARYKSFTHRCGIFPRPTCSSVAIFQLKLRSAKALSFRQIRSHSGATHFCRLAIGARMAVTPIAVRLTSVLPIESLVPNSRAQ